MKIILRGKLFTWYRPDGTCKSKLDRMLVNEEWIERWPNHVLKDLGRSFSDHQPICIDCPQKDWGPKPFRFMNCWTSHPSFNKFIKDKWESYEINGWRSFILK
ncbi:hypothetical protein ACS0TY_035266 [Phlomoides rotata]